MLLKVVGRTPALDPDRCSPSCRSARRVPMASCTRDWVSHLPQIGTKALLESSDAMSSRSSMSEELRDTGTVQETRATGWSCPFCDAKNPRSGDELDLATATVRPSFAATTAKDPGPPDLPATNKVGIRRPDHRTPLTPAVSHGPSTCARRGRLIRASGLGRDLVAPHRHRGAPRSPSQKRKGHARAIARARLPAHLVASRVPSANPALRASGFLRSVATGAAARRDAARLRDGGPSWSRSRR
jgi:hypothetical protein